MVVAKIEFEITAQGSQAADLKRLMSEINSGKFQREFEQQKGIKCKASCKLLRDTYNEQN